MKGSRRGCGVDPFFDGGQLRVEILELKFLVQPGLADLLGLSECPLTFDSTASDRAPS